MKHRDRWIIPAVILRYSFLSFLRNRDLHMAATLAFYGVFALIPLCLAVLVVLSQVFVSSRLVSGAIGLREALASLDSRPFYSGRDGQLFWGREQTPQHKYAPDLIKDPDIRRISRQFVLWTIVSLATACGTSAYGIYMRQLSRRLRGEHPAI